jgi:hypothetical protein
MSRWLRTGAFDTRDEYYTPKILTDVIVPFIPPGKIVWCPFDTTDSEFVHSFKDRNPVIHTHIWTGQDFFSYEPSCYDYIVSNPPFSKKMEVLERLYSLDKPFAMIFPLPMLNYHEVGSFFIKRELQLLIVNKKVSFNGRTASFNNSYFCRNVLSRDLIFVPIAHNNAGRYYTSSRMTKKQGDISC